MFKSYQREHYFDEMFGLQSDPLLGTLEFRI